MATHSSTLAWRIPWTEEPGGLQSMGSQSQTRLSVQTRTHTHRYPGNHGDEQEALQFDKGLNSIF